MNDLVDLEALLDGPMDDIDIDIFESSPRCTKESTLNKYNLKMHQVPDYSHIEKAYDELGIDIFKGDLKDAIDYGLKWTPYKFQLTNIVTEIKCPLTSDILNIISEYIKLQKVPSITDPAPSNIADSFRFTLTLHIILNASKVSQSDAKSSNMNIITNKKSDADCICLEPILCIETCSVTPSILYKFQQNAHSWESRRQRANESDMMHTERMKTLNEMHAAEREPFIEKFYYYCDEKQDNLLDHLRVRNYEKWEKREDYFLGRTDWWGNQEIGMRVTKFELFNYCERVIDNGNYLYAKINGYSYKPKDYGNGFGFNQSFEFGIMNKHGSIKETHNIYSKGYQKEQLIACGQSNEKAEDTLDLLAELEAMMN